MHFSAADSIAVKTNTHSRTLFGHAAPLHLNANTRMPTLEWQSSECLLECTRIHTLECLRMATYTTYVHILHMYSPILETLIDSRIESVHQKVCACLLATYGVHTLCDRGIVCEFDPL